MTILLGPMVKSIPLRIPAPLLQSPIRRLIARTGLVTIAILTLP